MKEIYPYPYYFDLEDIFLECAGIKPATTADEIFHGSDEEIEFDAVEDMHEEERRS